MGREDDKGKAGKAAPWPPLQLAAPRAERRRLLPRQLGLRHRRLDRLQRRLRVGLQPLVLLF